MKRARSGKKKQSLRAVSLRIVIPVTLALAAILVFLSWGVQENRRLANRYIQDTAQLYVDQINKTLYQISNEMIVLLRTDKDIAAIPTELGPRDGTYYQMINNIKEQNNILKIRYDEIRSFFVYGQEADLYIDTEGTSFRESAKSEFNTLLTGILLEEVARNTIVPHWQLLETSTDHYIVGWYAKDKKAIGCIMRVEDIWLKLEAATESYQAIPFMELEDGRILMSERSKGIYGEDFLTNSRYRGQIYHYQIGNLGQLQLYILPDGGIMENLLNMQMVLALFVFVLLMICGVVVYFYNRQIMEPMKRFVAGLNELDEEQMLHDNGANSLLELEAASDKFKELLRKIQSLKIAIYEEELLKQKTELEFAQGQIKPHFFLNCLSLIHGIADTVGQKQILHITEVLSNYMRYIFRDSGGKRLLSEELEHVRLFLTIQKLRYGEESFSFVEFLDEAVEQALIPSLLLQTLVENAFVHALTMDHAVEISLYATTEHYDDGQYLYISISDTGKGFTKEVLQALEEDTAIVYDGRTHVGLQNARRRLQLLYGKRASIAFSNMDEGFGAVVEVRIPWDQC
ncbi:histidine kinase [Ruminococcaceae bacterium OttesenSCG-928-L11]|nr:histidine kinase [Ruminococcaceae bacterium OttesenSCG-928-L11]